MRQEMAGLGRGRQTEDDDGWLCLGKTQTGRLAWGVSTWMTKAEGEPVLLMEEATHLDFHQFLPVQWPSTASVTIHE